MLKRVYFRNNLLELKLDQLSRREKLTFAAIFNSKVRVSSRKLVHLKKNIRREVKINGLPSTISGTLFNRHPGIIIIRRTVKCSDTRSFRVASKV